MARTQLPRFANSKKDKKVSTEQRERYVAPSTPIEQLIAAVWKDLLGMDRVGIHDDFFDLGGHSLVAIQTLSLVRQMYDVELTVRELFDAPTVASLATRVDAARGSRREDLIPRHPEALLSLDDDVSVLLERAHRQCSRSREELGNDLLRESLTRLSALPPAAERPVATLEAQIDQLYDDIRDLVARSAEDSSLEAEVELKREELHSLQAKEAKAWREQADARRQLKPGDGYRLLERAEKLLAS